MEKINRIKLELDLLDPVNWDWVTTQNESISMTISDIQYMLYDYIRFAQDIKHIMED